MKLPIAIGLTILPGAICSQIIAEYDPAYGGGINWNAFTGQSSSAVHLAELSNGDLLGIGQREFVVNALTTGPFSFRTDPHGLPIRTYGRFGSQRANTGWGGDDYYSTAVIHPNGDHWVLCTPGSNVLAAFDADGLPLSSFGTNGVVEFPSSAYRSYRHFGVQPDGKIVLGGRQGPGNALLITRLLPNGTTDAQFGSNGHLVLSNMRECLGFQMMADGRFLVNAELVTTPLTHVISMFSADGILDPAFMGDGMLDLPMPVHGLSNVEHFIRLEDGRLLLGGDNSGPFGSRVVMLTSNGIGPDPGFTQLSSAIGDLNWMQVMPDTSLFISFGTQWSIMHVLPNGSPDPVFGTNGELSLDRYQRIKGVISTDEGILVFGTMHRTDYSWEFGITRLAPDGSEDATFCNGGTAPYHAFDKDVLAADLAVDGQGRAIGIGGSIDQLSGDGNYWIGRVNQSGVPDTSFADLGSLAPLRGPLRFVEALPNDDLVILGQQSSSSGFDTWPILVRASSSGAQQPGWVQSISGSTASFEYVKDMRIGSDGKVYFIVSCSPGSGVESSYVGRVSVYGEFDGTFGNNGVFLDPNIPLRTQGYCIDLFPSGDILAVQIVEDSLDLGLSFNKLQLRRLSPVGVPVMTWGVAGRVRTDLAATGGLRVRPKCLRMLPDGRFLLAYYGVGYTTESHYLACFLENGQLDGSFGTNGVVDLGAILAPQPLYEDEVDMVVQPGGRITLVLRTNLSPSNYALVRLLPDGSIDLSFGQDGLMPIALPGGNALFNVHVALTPNSQIMVSGEMNSDPAWTMTDWFTFQLLDDISVSTLSTDNSVRALVRAAPNPSTGHVVLEFSVERPGPVSSVLYDGHGRSIVAFQDYIAAAGFQQQRVQWPDQITSGLYWLRVTSAEFSCTIPVAIHRGAGE